MFLYNALVTFVSTLFPFLTYFSSIIRYDDCDSFFKNISIGILFYVRPLINVEISMEWPPVNNVKGHVNVTHIMSMVPVAEY